MIEDEESGPKKDPESPVSEPTPAPPDVSLFDAVTGANSSRQRPGFESHPALDPSPLAPPPEAFVARGAQPDFSERSPSYSEIQESGELTAVDSDAFDPDSPSRYAAILPEAATRRAKARIMLRIPDDSVPISSPRPPPVSIDQEPESAPTPSAIIHAMRVISIGEPAPQPLRPSIPQIEVGEDDGQALTPEDLLDNPMDVPSSTPVFLPPVAPLPNLPQFVPEAFATPIVESGWTPAPSVEIIAAVDAATRGNDSEKAAQLRRKNNLGSLPDDEVELGEEDVAPDSKNQPAISVATPRSVPPPPPSLGMRMPSAPNFTPSPPPVIMDAPIEVTHPPSASIPEWTPVAVSESVPAGDDLEELDAEEIVEPSPKPRSIPAPPRPASKDLSAPAPTSSPIPPPAPPSAKAASVPPTSTDALQAQRRRVRPWWEELFTDDFTRALPRLTPDQVRKETQFIEDSLAVQRSGVILDLGCGYGQHAVELASKGYNVVGYDLSLTMLALAADEAQEREQKINFLQGDMREMAFEEMFDGVYSWATSFGFFDEEKNAVVIQRVHRALRQGGMFLLDVVNRDFICSRLPTLAWFQGDGCVCIDDAQLDSITSRLRVKRTLMMEDGRTRELEYSIRLYALHEIGKILHDCGFKVVEVSGQPGTSGAFFGAESPRLIILAERR